MDSSAPDVIERLAAAMNDHDADRVAACMTEDYRSVAPAHPERNFTGREQVRRNWQAAFESAPDLEADPLRVTVEDGTAWVEWHIHGTRTDDSEMHLRGVAIWGIDDDLIEWGHIYLEQTQHADDVTWEEFYSGDVGNE